MMLPLGSELPAVTGVYVFWGEGQLPLYIGKSIDIRARFRAHQLAADEAEMMSRVQRIEIHETAGEIGALLLESRLIKHMHPLHNIRLRRVRPLVCIQLMQAHAWPALQLVQPKDPQWAMQPDRFGVFASRHAAHRFLHKLAQRERLCLSVMGLEPRQARGCFARQLQACDGACVGAEPLDLHHERLRTALSHLQIHVWSFPGAIELIEQQGGWQQRLGIDRWQHVSTWCSKTGDLQRHDPEGFDWDTYRILVGPVLMGKVKWEPARSAKPARRRATIKPDQPCENP